MSVEPFQPVDSTGDAWHEIEDLLKEVAQLAKSHLPKHEFYAQLLHRTTLMIAAVRGAVWLIHSDGRLALECQTRPADGADIDGRHDDFRRRMLDEVIRRGEAAMIPPATSAATGQEAINPTGFLLLAAPIKLDTDVVGILEVVQRPISDPAIQRGNLQLVTAVSELAATFHTTRELRELRRLNAFAGQVERFAHRIHASSDLLGIAYEVVNEGRRLVGCDRLSVALKRGKKYELLAISGSQYIERRSNVVRHLQELIRVTLANGEPFWHGADSAVTLPEAEELLQSYLDEAHVRTLAITPLRIPSESNEQRETPVLGALVAERFDAVSDELMAQRAARVAAHSASALRHALELKGIPLASVLRVLSRSARLATAGRPGRKAAAVAAGILVLSVLMSIPVGFKVEGQGELQPREQRDVFAPMDGEIRRLFVESGSRVSPGTVLAVLDSPQLDLEFQRVQGELETVQKRLLAVESARVQSSTSMRRSDSQSSRLTGDQEELRQLRDGYQQQLELLRHERERLTIKSPIDGHVLTWNVSQLLDARPVQRGQVLMTVADVDGPWLIELEVPNDQIDHLLQAQAKADSPLDTSFFLLSSPGTVYSGTVEKVSKSVDTENSKGDTVRVVIRIDRDQIASLRPGAAVLAKVHCGRRSIAYVWLHDLVEVVRTTLLF
jgi:multidrug efflux pump subunit AcrA (membrane-fusion protein)